MEIIAKLHGFKDYDKVEIKEKKFLILNACSNLVNTLLNVHYKAENSNSAYLMVVPDFTGTSNQYIFDTNQTVRSINISNYEKGNML